MTNIISAWADTQKTEEVLNNNPELKKLVHEFTARFKGFFVSEMYSNNKIHPNAVSVLTENGLVAGSLTVDSTIADGKRVPCYMFSSSSIRKERSSRNSDNRTRDSIKITGLLKSIEKNNEVPSVKTIYKEFSGGIAYAFGSLAERKTRIPSVQNDLAIEVLKRFSGRDSTPLPISLQEQVNKVLDEYQKAMTLHESAMATFERYAKGCTLIAWGRGVKPHYLVGTCRQDIQEGQRASDTSRLVIGDLVRYNTLADTPHAGLAVMFREYFKNSNHSDEDNEMGFAFHDQYHEDIDVSCGYSGGQYCWILIPNEAPTV